MAGDNDDVTSRPSRIEWVIIALEVFLILGAVTGAAGLLSAPDGSAMGWTTDQLRGTPFADYFIPGLILLAANGLLPAAVVVAALRRSAWANWGHVAVGCVLVGWIATQLALVGYGALIQPLFGLLGLIIAGLGVAAMRHASAEQGLSA